MWKRVLWDVLCLILVIIAPWWVCLIAGIIGAILFPWYLEILFFGIIIDILYGNTGSMWHIKHAIIFAIPLVVAEIVKPRLNW